MHPAKLYRIFIATPNDLNPERQAVREIVDQFHRSFSKETEWGLELLGWETTLPATGRPQSLINVDVDRCDLFIACLWQRWGSPSGLGVKTGFEEEFDRAVERNVNTGVPEIVLFFKKPGSVVGDECEEQLGKVKAFRSRLIDEKQILFREFSTRDEWIASVSECIHRKLLQLVSGQIAPGLGSSATIEYGQMQYVKVVPANEAFQNLTIHFDRGFVRRRPEGGMCLRMRPNHPYPTLAEFQNVLAPEIEMESLASTLSSDPKQPTVFVGAIAQTIPAGTNVPDQVHIYRATPSTVSAEVRATATLRVFLDGETLRGTVEAHALGTDGTVHGDIQLRLR